MHVHYVVHMPTVDLLPTSEAAARLGVSVWTVHRWAASGRITVAAKTPGPRGALLFDADEVQRVADELATEEAS